MLRPSLLAQLRALLQSDCSTRRHAESRFPWLAEHRASGVIRGPEGFTIRPQVRWKRTDWFPPARIRISAAVSIRKGRSWQLVSRRSCSGMISISLTYVIANFRPGPIPDSRKQLRLCAEKSPAFLSMMHLPNFPASHARLSGDQCKSTCRAAHGRGKDACGTGSSGRPARSTPRSDPKLVAAPLDVTSREDAGDVVQDVGGRVLVVAVIANESGLNDVDLLLGVLVDHA
jgi:hypothetical protein